MDGDGGAARRVSAEHIIVAVGTQPAHPVTVDFDGLTIIDSDGLLSLERIPGSLVVVGAGVIGIEYASMLAALGTKVTIVEQRPRMLEFCDGEVVEALQHHLRDLGVVFRFGDTVTAVERPEGGSVTHLASGKRIAADAVFYAAGRQGATSDLDLSNAGLDADERGRISVGRDFRTAAGHIFAVGDVIGFPSLAATSSEQGRLAARHACGGGRRRDGDVVADRDLRDPRDQLRRPDRGGAERGRCARTRRASPATASSPAGRSSATPTGC